MPPVKDIQLLPDSETVISEVGVNIDEQGSSSEYYKLPLFVCLLFACSN